MGLALLIVLYLAIGGLMICMIYHLLVYFGYQLCCLPCTVVKNCCTCDEEEV